jgi:hypothetical protein
MIFYPPQFFGISSRIERPLLEAHFLLMTPHSSYWSASATALEKANFRGIFLFGTRVGSEEAKSKPCRDSFQSGPCTEELRKFFPSTYINES